MSMSREVFSGFVAVVLLGACGKQDATTTTGSGSAATPSAPAAATEQIAFASGAIFYKAADGTVKSWGSTDSMLARQVPEADAPTTPGIVTDLGKVKSLAVGGGQTMCAVLVDGTAKCWGNGKSGELGDGKDGKSDAPVVVPGLANVAAIGIGDYYACALVTDGTVKCWGNNGYHQASVQKQDKLVTPTAMPDVTGAVQIAVGGSTSCALGKDGSVKCWGLECSAEGGTQCDKPFTNAGLAGSTFIAAGWQSICAIAKDSTVKCFGRNNDYGQLGNGTNASSQKLEIVKGLTGATALAAGQQHWCALVEDGTVQCWGANEFGQLGDGTLPEGEKHTFRATPAPVKGIADAVALSCDGGTCCAQVKDKSVKCWGENLSFFGEAHAETSNVPTPVLVSIK